MTSNEQLSDILRKLKDDAWECRGALRRFEMDVRELVQNGGMTQTTRTQLSRAADKADAAEKKAMEAIKTASAEFRKCSAHETSTSLNTSARDSSACEQAWYSFANRDPAPTHKDCFHAGWVSGKGYARDLISEASAVKATALPEGWPPPQSGPDCMGTD